MTTEPTHSQDLGRLEGIVAMLRDQHQENQAELKAIRSDVTSLKVEGGKQGAVYGGLMAIGVALIIEGAKDWVKRAASGPG